VRQARAEDRVLVTRDRQLARRRGIQVLLVTGPDLDSQLAEVVQKLALPPPQPGTRCQHCNEPLRAETPAAAADAVPPYVLQTRPAFRRCPHCRRVYWRGSHWEAIKEKARLLGQQTQSS